MIRPLLLLLFSAVALAACTSSPDGVSHEASVRPGINAPYYANPDPEQWTERFEAESRDVFTWHEEILQALDLKLGMAVADVGAGTGLFTLPMARLVGSEGHVWAVDILPEFLAHIEARAARAGIENVVTVLGREDSVELPPESVDLVFVCDTYHHFEYPKRSLRSIHRALKPFGQLVVIDFRRIPGVSRPWIIDHVRAGEEVVAKEIREAGFVRTGRRDFLSENYFLRFMKVE